MKHAASAVTLAAATGAACLLALACVSRGGPAPDARHLVPLRDTWKAPPRGKLASPAGYPWSRCRVKVPASWQGKALELFVEPVDAARAVYFNGVQVGAAGTFPPRYRSGLAEPARHRVPKRLVRPREHNVVAVRAYYYDGRSNFTLPPPVPLCDKEAARPHGPWPARPPGH